MNRLLYGCFGLVCMVTSAGCWVHAGPEPPPRHYHGHRYRYREPVVEERVIVRERPRYRHY